MDVAASCQVSVPNEADDIIVRCQWDTTVMVAMTNDANGKNVLMAKKLDECSFVGPCLWCSS